jgi:SAM-dependent methyltransferase
MREGMGMAPFLPRDFDPEIYLRLHPDVAAAGMRAEDHYLRFGIVEGRRYRVDFPPRTRGDLVARALLEHSVLEIGPFCNPVLKAPHVAYFDVLDTGALVERARKIGYPIIAAPQIDFVSPVGDLSVVDRQFHACLSAHCIEHQPDLVGHLQELGRIILPGGAYYLAIPDKRYCFDALLDVSNLAEVVAAHIEGRKVHTLASVIEHRALTTHNDPVRHWADDHINAGYRERIAPRTVAAIAEWTGAAGGYVDVHAWQFTPDSFQEIVSQLRALNYVDFAVEHVAETPRNSLEFVAVLRRT